jgi:RNA polymerase sigma-70 factor (ECF subfamily)
MSIHRSFDQLTDAELMTQIVHRSERALEILYSRHVALLRSVAMRVLSDHAEVDDTMQDVLIHLWNRSADYSSEKGQPLGWLVTIARRRALDRARRRTAIQGATQRYLEKAKHEVTAQGTSCDVDRDVAYGEMRLLVDKGLQELPPAQKEVVTMAFLNEMSQREISARLHLPLGTVKTRIELGMKKLSRSAVLHRAA